MKQIMKLSIGMPCYNCKKQYFNGTCPFIKIHSFRDFIYNL